ncbi:hypothetical protein HZH68_016179 [Vespula germanica]|uniref:Uncharacterized protein n=1 Tax=Vespula germanica TaxID=30212 RepID=A0A834MRT0_VESGE|nr:hypothetical protein HZH68_016179 [Vespula germanica]
MVYEPGVLTGLYGAKASVMCHCRRSTVSEWLSRTCSGGGASVVARRTGRLTGGWPTGGGKAWGNTSVVAGEGATRGPRLDGPRYETEPVSRLPVEFSIFPAVVLSPNKPEADSAGVTKEFTGTGIEYHPFPFPTLTATFERVIRSIPTCHAKDTKLPEVTYTRHELLRSLAISGYSTSWLIAICGEYFWGLNSVCLWKADSVVISRSDARVGSCWKYSKGAGVFDLTTGVGCLKD